MKGVVLAAGEGTRMQIVTYGAFPKELLTVGSIPTIRYPIEALRLAGIQDILVVIAPQTKHNIIDFLQSGKRFGVNICYVVQERNENGSKGIGQAILSTKHQIQKNEDFVVACGDTILCNIGDSNPLDCLKPLLDVHSSSDALATVVVHQTASNPTRFGVVKFKDLAKGDRVLCGEVEAVVEKPDPKTARTYERKGYYYVIAGYYVFKPEIFSYLEKTKPDTQNELQITNSMALALKEKEKICAVVHARIKNKHVVLGDYWDVGIPEEYEAANRRFLEKNAG